MKHSVGFLTLVEDAKVRITEISVEDLPTRLMENPETILLDVREDIGGGEWSAACLLRTQDPIRTHLEHLGEIFSCCNVFQSS